MNPAADIKKKKLQKKSMRFLVYDYINTLDVMQKKKTKWRNNIGKKSEHKKKAIVKPHTVTEPPRLV